jgi:hypothetical protein
MFGKYIMKKTQQKRRGGKTQKRRGGTKETGQSSIRYTNKKSNKVPINTWGISFTENKHAQLNKIIDTQGSNANRIIKKDRDVKKNSVSSRYFESYKDEQEREAQQDALAKNMEDDRNMRAHNEANKRSSADWRFGSKTYSQRNSRR